MTAGNCDRTRDERMNHILRNQLEMRLPLIEAHLHSAISSRGKGHLREQFAYLLIRQSIVQYYAPTGNWYANELPCAQIIRGSHLCVETKRF